MRALSAYSAFGVAGGSSRLSAAGPGSSQMRLSSETKSMDFFVEGRGRSSAFLRPLPSFSTVEGMWGASSLSGLAPVQLYLLVQDLLNRSAPSTLRHSASDVQIGGGRRRVRCG